MDWDIIVCTIVANAGESRSASLAAIEAAGDDDFEAAERLMQESEKAYLLAHEAHMEMLKRAAGDEPVPMNFLIVHAATHLSNAEVTKDLARQMISILKKRR